LWQFAFEFPPPRGMQCILSIHDIASVLTVTINPLATELNPICKSQLAELFCGGI